ncbi:EAL domain-containing protein [Aestuariispira insulae]|nr:EAL domain-containing protein [Aestuariispira insulae]
MMTSFNSERDRFVAYAFAAAHMFVELDPNGVIKHASGTTSGLASGKSDDLVEKKFASFVDPGDQAYFAEILLRLFQHGRIEPRLICLTSKTGKRLELLMGGLLLPSQEQRLFLSFTVPPKTNIKPKNDSQAGGRKTTETDLLDKRDFGSVAQDKLATSESMDVNSQLTMLVIDGLDELRSSGDMEKLARVLEKLSAYLRAISFDGTCASELGSEKFGVLHSANVDEKEIKARIAEIIAEEAADTDLEVKSFSMDFDTHELSETDATKALLYSVQKFVDTDPNEFSITSLQSSAREMLNDVVNRVNQVREIIDRRNFDVVFQPIVDIYTEDVHHLEALTRITGLASPQAFIEFTEEVGLIEDFDLTLAQRVMEELANHRKGGWKPRVAINLSAKSMNSSIFRKSFEEVLAPFSEIQEQLMLELTETVSVSNFEELNKVLQEYRNAGMQVCIDDVGSGSTSFQSLYDLEVDFLKIDGRFVRAANTNERDMTLLKSIIEVGKKLNTKLIAEQIEDREQAHLMESLGVEYGQGYLYGRPTLDHSTFKPGMNKPKAALHDTERKW